MNIKRSERIYKKEGLLLRVRRRKKLASQGRIELPKPEKMNEQWAMDFLHDALSTGRRFRVLAIMDTHTRECLRIEVNTSIGGQRVTEILSQTGSVRDYRSGLSLITGRNSSVMRLMHGPMSVG